ncbi:FecCD family ABC transporter permease [Candidatus Contubernalis alkaliaceticus]|uniref:FecCD family ABC transporter permease n=1 Tax=Candidatus Contubernalis alkaliaceticus TaxID=338645 RepID=UPI001F4BF738|nr:iron ABC transporter permease [Candidatus Contubernalis alkalaceticus]UNC93065.1 iron ABC transporter permease [Candidatus Contubernalis alkalaceticus]
MELGKVRNTRVVTIFIFLLFLLLVSFIINISLGSVGIGIGEVVDIITKQLSGEGVHQAIIWKIRFPRTLAAILGGASLAAAGLLLQVFFRNPIVGPFVLGISSGATLMVGLVILAGFTFGMKTVSPFLIVGAAFLGAILVMAVVLLVSSKVKSIVTLLVIGLMVGYLCSAVTSLLTALAEKEKVHGFVMWSMGSFSGYTWQQVGIVAAIGIPLLLASFFICKPLNAFLLGEDYAKSMGINIKSFRFVIVSISSVLAALITAFTGPVAFIGMAVPHIARMLFQTSDNRVLIPGTILLGGIITALCDLTARMLLSPVELPVSAITSFFGAPIVIMMLLKRRNAM